jgi:phospholipase/carboxylesterase
MRSITFFLLLMAFILIGISSPLLADDVNGIDWNNPDSINPLQEGVGDFLDINLDEARQLAYDKYMAGDYETAAKYYLAILRFNITDGSSIYNLACCYGLMGEAELAAKFVERAYNAGYTDVGWISSDPDFTSVKDNPVFALTLAGLAERASEEESKLGDMFYLDAEGFFECRVMLPDNYDPTIEYPLIIGLHGYGSNIDQFIGLYGKFQNHDFIYATPRAPFPFFNGTNLGFSWVADDPNNVGFGKRSIDLAVEYVAGAVGQLKERYNVGDVYLLGFSQGCGLAYMAGIKHHELFNGLICFGGWVDTDYLDEETIQAGNDLRIFIGHATDDRVVEYQNAVDARDLLMGYGYDVTFFDYTGGHSVPEIAIAQVEQWLKGAVGDYIYF